MKFLLHKIYISYLGYRGLLVGVDTVKVQSKGTGSTPNLGANVCEMNECVDTGSIKIFTRHLDIEKSGVAFASWVVIAYTLS